MASVLERPWHTHRKCARRTSVCYKVSRVPQSNLSDLIYRLETEVQRNEMTAQDQGQVIKDNHPNTGLATQKYCFCRSPPPGTNVLSGLAGGEHRPVQPRKTMSKRPATNRMPPESREGSEESLCQLQTQTTTLLRGCVRTNTRRQFVLNSF